ncbi:MAG TPA: ATP-binding cassette domain-containing protein, partial [Spirochaetia bacterium]|nr:ATP-binding cassette domain-containing protein [Spirochaetia bacterium]
MIEARELVKRYGSVEAIRGVTFEVRTGEIVGLLGPNGAGKTTVMKILTCYHHPTSGTALVDSHDVMTESIEVRRSVGYLPENAPVYHDLKVFEYLDFVAQVRGFNSRNRRERVDRAMSLCGLASMAYRTIGKLSKGYRQRVGLAQAILHDPQTLILDEPTTGLDPNQIVEIRDLVREIGKSRTVILSTHILGEVENLCRRVLILNRGVIAAQGTSAELAEMVSGQRTVVELTVQVLDLASLQLALSGLPRGATASQPIALSSERFTLEISLEASLSEADVFRWAVARGLTIVNMAAKKLDLEEIFHQLTR